MSQLRQARQVLQAGAGTCGDAPTSGRSDAILASFSVTLPICCSTICSLMSSGLMPSRLRAAWMWPPSSAESAEMIRTEISFPKPLELGTRLCALRPCSPNQTSLLERDCLKASSFLQYCLWAAANAAGSGTAQSTSTAQVASPVVKAAKEPRHPRPQSHITIRGPTLFI